jgi:peptide/nickel transport system permease protein
MLQYVIQRIIATIPVVLLVAIITFSLVHIAPGDPAAVIAGDFGNPEDIQRVRKQLGLDKPIHEQLWIWLSHVARGDLGSSIFSRYPVTELIAQRLQPTIVLALASEILAVVIAVPLGVIAAWKANTLIDRAIMLFAVLGFSIPVFWLAYNLIFLFAVRLEWLPAVGYEPISNGIVPWLKSITLPTIAIAVIFAALIARMTRTTMLEILREDYIRTARAKGLTPRKVIFLHAFKNAVLPVITVSGWSLGMLLGGTIVIEKIFLLPGMGTLLVDSVTARDYTLIQAEVLVFAIGILTVNLLVDLVYVWLDPRIRYA